MSADTYRRTAIGGLATVVLLAGGSGLAWLLEDRVGVPNASSVFLLAVVLAAGRFGTWTAVSTAVGAFLVYDFFFTEPRFTVTVADPGEWLNLVLLLVVGIVVGRLAAAQRDRAEAAIGREREAVSLFRISRALATRSSTAAALPELASILRAETAMDRIRIATANSAGLERTAVDATASGASAASGPSADPGAPGATGGAAAHADSGAPRAVGDTAATGREGAAAEAAWTPPVSHLALRRTPGDAPAEWVRVHQSLPVGLRSAPGGQAPGAGRTGRADSEAYRVLIEAGDRRLGSIWAVRARGSGRPDAAQTLLLSAAADQIGQALEQDRLGREAREMEIARRSDALKTALLESVSHDLRTPLTSIRAAAGTLLDRAVPLDATTQEATAEAIDREAEHLNRLVTNLLDLSRIEAGELRADLEPFELASLVERAVERVRPRLGERALEVDVPDDLPPVLVDEVFIDQVLTNLLDNAIKYTPPDARIRIRAAGPVATSSAAPEPLWSDAGGPIAAVTAPTPVGRVVPLTIDDDGPGVPDEALDRLFERFFRVRRRGEPSRPGSGIGLTVVRGLVEAMGGRVRAARSELGGVAIELRLPSVAPPAAAGTTP